MKEIILLYWSQLRGFIRRNKDKKVVRFKDLGRDSYYVLFMYNDHVLILPAKIFSYTFLDKLDGGRLILD
ncbi:MAG: hypothetical protein DRJ41_04465 [Thermoprotei archaeon]|nr:MAG: hypothetical protein DRJ41_04465 [Thermoprotei archaeon]